MADVSNDKDLILRDVLALDRTSLANERTLLAYVRTAAALIGGGIGLLHIFSAAWAQISGWALIVVGGSWRYFVMRSKIRTQAS